MELSKGYSFLLLKFGCTPQQALPDVACFTGPHITGPPKRVPEGQRLCGVLGRRGSKNRDFLFGL